MVFGSTMLLKATETFEEEILPTRPVVFLSNCLTDEEAQRIQDIMFVHATLPRQSPVFPGNPPLALDSHKDSPSSDQFGKPNPEGYAHLGTSCQFEPCGSDLLGGMANQASMADDQLQFLFLYLFICLLYTYIRGTISQMYMKRWLDVHPAMGDSCSINYNGTTFWK